MTKHIHFHCDRKTKRGVSLVSPSYCSQYCTAGKLPSQGMSWLRIFTAGQTGQARLESVRPSTSQVLSPERYPIYALSRARSCYARKNGWIELVSQQQQTYLWVGNNFVTSEDCSSVWLKVTTLGLRTPPRHTARSRHKG